MPRRAQHLLRTMPWALSSVTSPHTTLRVWDRSFHCPLFVKQETKPILHLIMLLVGMLRICFGSEIYESQVVYFCFALLSSNKPC